MQGTQDIIEMIEIQPNLREVGLLQRFRANINSLDIQQIKQLSIMCEDDWSQDYLAELGKEERQNLLNILRIRQTQLLMYFYEQSRISVASLEKQKQSLSIRIKTTQEKNMLILESMCGRCFYKKFDSFFALVMIVVCLAAAMMCNWIIKHLGKELNSQMVLLIIGATLVVSILVLCCLGINHQHDKPEKMPEIGRNRRNQRHQGVYQRTWRNIIQFSNVDQCIELLFNGLREDFQRVTINQISYIRNLVEISRVSYNVRRKCFSQLDKILLERYRERDQRLKNQVKQLIEKLQQLLANRYNNYQCDKCWPCRLTSHTSIFCIISAIIAVGITQVTTVQSVPLNSDWSPTWAVTIMLIVLLLLLALQVLYRIFRSKTPYFHTFF